MNCETIRQRLLLEQSGELRFWKRPGLSKHLAQCEACRAWSRELRLVTSWTREAAWEDDSAVNARQIAAACRKVPGHLRHPGAFTQAWTWQPALVYAAASIALASLFVFITQRFQAPDQWAAAPQAISTAFAGDADLDGGIAAIAQWMNNTDSDWDDLSSAADSSATDVNTIARQLLALEGDQI